eukprot:s1425_g17.t1
MYSNGSDPFVAVKGFRWSERKGSGTCRNRSVTNFQAGYEVEDESVRQALRGQAGPGLSEAQHVGCEQLCRSLQRSQQKLDAEHQVATATWGAPLSLFSESAQQRAAESGVHDWAILTVMKARRLVEEAAGLGDLTEVYKAQILTAQREKRKVLREPLCKPICWQVKFDVRTSDESGETRALSRGLSAEGLPLQSFQRSFPCGESTVDPSPVCSDGAAQNAGRESTACPHHARCGIHRRAGTCRTVRGDGMDKTHKDHAYGSAHMFGHHDVRNNMNPFLAHYRIPKWETTSTMYGEHYRHPEQTYTRPMKNRMPVFHINL